MQLFNKKTLNRIRKIINKSPIYFYQKLRILKYKYFSNSRNVENEATLNQPVLFLGEGSIILKKCTMGIWPSPFFFNGYIHLEARNIGSRIFIDDNVFINNGAVIIADKNIIHIGKNTLIGSEFTVYDSDFHGLNPQMRFDGSHSTAPVIIGENVFIGSRVTILKGVTIGSNSVIGNGSIVVNPIPRDVIAVGIPAKVVGSVYKDEKNPV